MNTYDEILQRMQETFAQQAGFQADDASDIGIRLKVLAGEIYSACSQAEFLKRQAFPQTCLLYTSECIVSRFRRTAGYL